MVWPVSQIRSYFRPQCLMLSWTRRRRHSIILRTFPYSKKNQSVPFIKFLKYQCYFWRRQDNGKTSILFCVLKVQIAQFNVQNLVITKRQRIQRRFYVLIDICFSFDSQVRKALTSCAPIYAGCVSRWK